MHWPTETIRWYFNGRIDLGAVVTGRRVNMFSVVKLMEIVSTENLQDLVMKSRSRMFGRTQHVVAEFTGAMLIEEQAFYEVKIPLRNTVVSSYVYACLHLDT